MLKLMLQKSPFYSQIPALMRLHWYSTDGSAEDRGVLLEECQTSTSTFLCTIISVI